MTYGWAILIIAVVLGALFQLGIFNASTFTPKAPPGACHVFRPNGPLTTSFINLQGICNGELPQYVAVFNGQSSQVLVSSLKGISTITSAGSGKITIVGWGLSSDLGAVETMYGYYNVGDLSDITIIIDRYDCSPSQVITISMQLGSLGGYNGELCNAQVSQNTWAFFAVTSDGSTINSYSSPSQGGSLAHNAGSITAGSTIQSGSPFIIGADSSSPLYKGWARWKGFVSNMQVYNTTLSQAEITALYNEGIGGAPVQLKNLVGWWPLNGDTKDYSGNGNNGVPTGVSFTSSWESGYSAP